MLTSYSSSQGLVRLSDKLDAATLEALVSHGLERQYSAACREWREKVKTIEGEYQASIKFEKKQALDRLEADKKEVQDCLQVALAEEVVQKLWWVPSVTTSIH